MDEGGATYGDNECFSDHPMYTINAYYHQQTKLFPLDSLIYHFDIAARENDVIAYIQSAGLFKFLFEKYGVEKIKKYGQMDLKILMQSMVFQLINWR